MMKIFLDGKPYRANVPLNLFQANQVHYRLELLDISQTFSNIFGMYAKPRSAYDQTGGMYYFASMLDKIRLHAAGNLHPDYHEDLGKWSDGRCCDYLRMAYDRLKAYVIQHPNISNEAVLQWCFDQGRIHNSNNIQIWNEAIAKSGWRDAIIPVLESEKQSSGLASTQTFSPCLITMKSTKAVSHKPILP